MANRGVDIGETPVNLVTALSLQSNQRYTLQIQDRGRVWIGDFVTDPTNPESNEDAFSINSREGTSFGIPSIPASGATWAWTDVGNSNRIVVNEAS